mgnify:CR=1 FL=1|jgi:hypothetical protein
MRVGDLETYQLADALIRSGLRISIVASLTGLSVKWLRQTHVHLFGVSPVNGRLPDNCLSFTQNYEAAARLSSFVTLHMGLHGGPVAGGKELLTTWREYERLCGAIDINAGYYVCRDVRVSIVSLMRCSHCRTLYIYDGKRRYTSQCPYCYLAKRQTAGRG